MHMAAEAGHVEVVTLLVESGASLRAESLVSCCCKLVIVVVVVVVLLLLFLLLRVRPITLRS